MTLGDFFLGGEGFMGLGGEGKVATKNFESPANTENGGHNSIHSL